MEVRKCNILTKENTAFRELINTIINELQFVYDNKDIASMIVENIKSKQKILDSTQFAGFEGFRKWALNTGTFYSGIEAYDNYEHGWAYKIKLISKKLTKERYIIEWHFVTPENKAHTIVLQHTHDARKLKTRRMLWVDGAEKYNSKSSASSFRIELDQTVVVLSIKRNVKTSNNKNLIGKNAFNYILQIDGLSYQDAYQDWKARKYNI